MRKFLISLAVVAMSTLAVTVASAAPPPRGSLTCFSEAPGTCSTNASKTTAIINTTAGGVAGVYVANFNGKSFYNKLTSQITTLQNNVAGTVPVGIDPRWSIPIDVDRDGDTDFFAFVAFADCNDTFGLVDVIHDSTCTVYRDGTAYANWAAMVAANPGDYISYADYAFIIADGSGAPGQWTLTNVKVGKTS